MSKEVLNRNYLRSKNSSNFQALQTFKPFKSKRSVDPDLSGLFKPFKHSNSSNIQTL